MDNSTFMEQIREDIALIQERLSGSVKNIDKAEYAFNYWILTNIYGMDEELCEENITEYSDKGLDCWTIDEEAKTLTIIQNKYYSESTPASSKDLSDFLTRPAAYLNPGTYKRSEALQAAWNKAKAEGYIINLDFYVTNDIQPADVMAVASNHKSDEFFFTMNFLKDIKKKVFAEDESSSAQDFESELKAISSMADAEGPTESCYALVKLTDLYDFMKSAKESGYDLYEKNVRDYLGNSSGINKGIVETLKSEKKKNFHLYSNGITMICSSASEEGGSISIKNPHIVNGCQSSNTISEVIKNEADKDAFGSSKVLVKILVLDSAREKELFKDIVKYTNSQNSINEKVFGATKKPFFVLQENLEKRGILVKVKQSDSYQISQKYGKTGKKAETAKILEKASDSAPLYRFGKISDITIDISTILQIAGAITESAKFSYTKKKNMLTASSEEYEKFSMNINELMTSGSIKKLIALYKKAEEYKKEMKKQKMPYSPYYLLNFVGFHAKSKGMRANEFLQKSSYEELAETFEAMKNLPTKYYKSKKTDYNKMIKQNVDEVLMKELLDEHFDSMKEHNPEKHESLMKIFSREMAEAAEA